LDDAEAWLYSDDSSSSSSSSTSDGGDSEVVTLGHRLTALKHMVDGDLCKEFLEAVEADKAAAEAEMEAAAQVWLTHEEEEKIEKKERNRGRGRAFMIRHTKVDKS
jgi:hypothetical protein